MKQTETERISAGFDHVPDATDDVTTFCFFQNKGNAKTMRSNNCADNNSRRVAIIKEFIYAIKSLTYSERSL